jgi:tetratricopeptide (TPR) repeat protein
MVNGVARMSPIGPQSPVQNVADAMLAEAGILSVQGLIPNSEYRFKHALIQETAYENLLRSRRQSLHRRVAEILRDRLADTAAAQPEVLAHHFTQASLPDAAIEWWGKAGDDALRRSAFQEAMAHLRKAIEMADNILSGPEWPAATNVGNSSQRVKLQVSYGKAMMWSRGFSSEESSAVFSRALQLAQGIHHANERFDAHYGLWLGRISRGEVVLARETAEAFQRDAEQMAETMEAAVSRRVLGTTCFAQGDFTAAVTHLEEALRTYDPERDREARFRFGSDTAAVATAYLAHAKWQFGEFARARELIQQAVARAVESAHAPTLAIVQHFKVYYEILRGDAAAAKSGAETLLDISREHGIALFLAMGAVSSAWARARLGDRGAVTELRHVAALFTGQGNKLWVPMYQCLLAEFEAEGGSVEIALSRIDEALALASQTGEHRFDARAAEMAVAFSAARKNRLDLSVGIALGSASQIALFVGPVLVLLSYVIGPTPMDLQLWPGAVVMVFISTLVAAFITSSGRSAWFVGVLLLFVYAVFAVTLYLWPPPVQ